VITASTERTFNVIWAESFGPEGPEGRCRDLGREAAAALPYAVRQGRREASRGGWGPGDVYVTDGLGNRLALPAAHEMN
jgi:hypothetical protein